MPRVRDVIPFEYSLTTKVSAGALRQRLHNLIENIDDDSIIELFCQICDGDHEQENTNP